MALCMVGTMMKHAVRKPLVVLFDTGSSHTWWNIKAIPGGVVPRKVDHGSSSTLAGPMQSNLEITLEDITFPEFFKTQHIGKVEARVFTAECRYDAIIGRDLLREIGLNLDFKNNKMTWDDCHVPMKVFTRELNNPYGIKEPSVAEQLFLDLMEADLEDDATLPTCDTTHLSDDDYSLNDEFYSDHGDDQAFDDDDVYAADSQDIKESKYEIADIDKVVRSCTHLDQTQQNDLREVLDRYPTLFNNELGTYPDEKIHLDLKEGAVPHCQPRAYSVPNAHRSVFKAELDRLVRIGVLEEGSRSEWIAGTFIVPKKLLPGETVPRVRWVSDFCGFNKCLKRKTYPIPRIGDILAR